MCLWILSVFLVSVFCVLFIPLNLHVVQPNLLILLPCPIIAHDLHVRIRIGCVQVLEVRVRERVVQDDRERPLDVLDLLQLLEERLEGVFVAARVVPSEELFGEFLVDLVEDPFERCESTAEGSGL